MDASFGVLSRAVIPLPRALPTHYSGRHDDREGDDQMTPEERNLIIDLFDRLATLEDAQRDPDAERLIRDGLRQAPNPPYALVQTVLVQDEALKRADERIHVPEAGSSPDTASLLTLSHGT